MPPKPVALGSGGPTLQVQHCKAGREGQSEYRRTPGFSVGEGEAAMYAKDIVRTRKVGNASIPREPAF